MQNVIYNTLGKMYFEVIKIKGTFLFASVAGGNYPISEPGAYLIDDQINLAGLYSQDSHFIDDPYFQSIPFGLINSVGDVNHKWGVYSGPVAEKRTDGRIHFNLSNSSAQGFEWWAPQWSGPSVVCNVELNIDYMPPGGSINVVTGGGPLNLNKAGNYSFNIIAAGTLAIWGPAVGVPGNAIISKFLVKKQGQPWTTIGDSFIQLGALWSSEASAFNTITNPKQKISSNQLQRQNLASAVRTEYPKLGYNTYLPPAGNYRVGDTIRNPTGQPSGWRCITAGNPGVWAPLASL